MISRACRIILSWIAGALTVMMCQHWFWYGLQHTHGCNAIMAYHYRWWKSEDSEWVMSGDWVNECIHVTVSACQRVSGGWVGEWVSQTVHRLVSEWVICVWASECSHYSIHTGLIPYQYCLGSELSWTHNLADGSPCITSAPGQLGIKPFTELMLIYCQTDFYRTGSF